MRAVRSLVLSLALAGWSGNVSAQAPAAAGAAVLVEKENVVEIQPLRSAWKIADLGFALAIRDRLRTGEFSRAAVRFTDLSMLRVDELTTIEILPPVGAAGKPTLDQKKGGSYFFSRDKTQEIEIRTPAANGALRGTEFELRVAANGRTRLTMFEGVVELGNAHGSVTLSSGEQAVVEVGAAPRKTAMIEAANIIQWCLYYPAVIDPEEFALPAAAKSRLATSLTAYRSGNLPAALRDHRFTTTTASTAERIYRAAVVLSVGRVDQARAALAGVPRNDPRRRAIERLIAAVTLQPLPDAAPPHTSREWLAESYFQQAHHDLDAALRAARTATELSPNFGYAWARVAELEFSFGRIPRSTQLLERSLELAPQNAQAHSLQGFLLSAENRMGAARRAFETAIALDGALGNAWLGRGLTAIRQNREAEGRHDLQTAAILEPNRSILRSYLGKAFSQVGINAKANLELDRAKQLDPNDPTPWLYSAIQRKQENRYNEAIADLEKSVALNDHRRLYRSEFLLDQDRAVRGANLAAIYRNNGMVEQGVREAVRAVGRDYGSAPAHLFLSEAYDALRDPTLVLARYETAWFSELLVANLLAPVGGGSLSQFVSQQEYSKLFERDRLGVSSFTEYSSEGSIRATGSQFGTVGNLSYALDGDYLYSNGLRPNNTLSRWSSVGTFKLALGVADSLFFQTTFGNVESGDLFQRYDPEDAVSLQSTITGENGLPRTIRIPNRSAQTLHFSERQDPGTLLAGWHHEWAPGNHTLLLLGRLANRQVLTQQQADFALVSRTVDTLAPPELDPFIRARQLPTDPRLLEVVRSLAGQGIVDDYLVNSFDIDYRSSFETYNAELQQIVTLGPTTTVLGGRYQRGEFETRVALGNYNAGRNPDDVWRFGPLPVRQEFTVPLERLGFYAYENLQLTRWLTLIGGVTFDHLQYPENFRNSPINGRESKDEEILPKAGLILEPWRGGVLRAAYARSVSGASFDESVRLEPTQIAGFPQAFRTVASEALVGPVSGSHYEIVNGSFEQRFPTHTYLGIEAGLIRQNLDRKIGVFDEIYKNSISFADLPSSLDERGSYEEKNLGATVNQLIGTSWSLGARYALTQSELRQHLPKIAGALDRIEDADTLNSLAGARIPRRSANLHQLSLSALYNHPSGWFVRGEAHWFRQDTDLYQTKAVALPPDVTPVLPRKLRTTNSGLPGEDFWQLNLLAGYRFYRNQCELSVGLLNLTGEDYRLDPLTPYAELPRGRTVVVRCKLNF